MEAAVVVIAVAAIAALVIREWQHDRARDRVEERHAAVLGDMASRVVRPLAPVPRRIAPPETPSEGDGKQNGQGHLVGRVAPPSDDAEE